MGWRDLVAKREAPAEEVVPEAASNGGWRERVAQRKPPVENVAEYQNTPFPEKRGETRAAKEMPELGQIMEADGIAPEGLLYGEDMGKVAMVAPAILTATNDQEVAKILQANFPNIGIQYDEGGNILAANNKTGVRNIINRPDMSQRDLMQLLGIGAAMFPATKAAALPGMIPGAIGAAGKKLLPKMAAGGAAAAATQVGIETAQEGVGGEFDKGEVVLSGVLGGAGEAIFPAIQAFKNTRAAKGLEVATRELKETIGNLKPSKEAIEAIKQATGIDVGLFKAQKTMQPTQLLKQRLLPQLDAGAKKAADALEKQNKEVYEATSEMLNTIAGPDVVESGTRRFRTAAQKAIDANKEIRKAGTKDLYKQAMDEGAEVNLSNVKTSIADILEDAPPGSEYEKIGNRLSKLISGESPTLRQLQKAKITMHDMTEKFGEGSLPQTIKREVLSVKKVLVEEMRKASDIFALADDEFARLTPAVSALEDSIIGSVSKFKDIDLQNISRRIFSANSNPSTVNQARKIIENADPGAWDDMLRVEFQRRIGGIESLADDLPGELVGNVPGQLRRALFGNPEQRRTLLSAMSEGQRKNFVYLDDILRRASSGRAAGSPTAPFAQAIEKLRGTAVVLRDLIFRPLAGLQKVGESRIFDRNVRKLTDVMFNPKWEPKMKQLISLDPASAKAEKLFKEIIDSSRAGSQAAGVSDEQ